MWFSKARIYLDHASAPPLLAGAVAAMREAEKLVGNPGAIHSEGVAAKRSLENSRSRIAAHLGIKARELVFTPGLTASNNLAILGYAEALARTRRSLKKTHWLVSSIEHDSVLECFARIEALGGSVSHIEPNEKGIIRPEVVEHMLTPTTVFVSIGWANNEIGTVQPIGKIARAIRAFEQKKRAHIIFHSDGGQAPLYLPTLVSSLGVDLLSIGANKLYGPHGIGALYLDNRVSLAPVALGGKQERGLHAGTENISLAAGFAAAFDVVRVEREKESLRIKALRDELARLLIASVPGVVVNGELKHALPHMLDVSIPDISGEYFVLALDHAGIAISTKSACREGEESISHVVAALGGEAWRGKNSLRFSLGRETTRSDIRQTAEAIRKLINKKDVV